ncbi:MAG: hypothetical protein RIT81_16400 [Deltaproteobacteria bacterium]
MDAQNCLGLRLEGLDTDQAFTAPRRWIFVDFTAVALPWSRLAGHTFVGCRFALNSVPAPDVAHFTSCFDGHEDWALFDAGQGDVLARLGLKLTSIEGRTDALQALGVAVERPEEVGVLEQPLFAAVAQCLGAFDPTVTTRAAMLIERHSPSPAVLDLAMSPIDLAGPAQRAELLRLMSVMPDAYGVAEELRLELVGRLFEGATEHRRVGLALLRAWCHVMADDLEARSAAALPWVERLLEEDADPRVLAEALELAGRLATEIDVERVDRWIGHEDARVSEAALEAALWLRPSEDRLAFSTSLGLGESQRAHLRDLERAQRSVGGSLFFDALPVDEALTSADRMRVLRAIEVCGSLQDPTLAPVVASLRDHEDEEVRAAARRVADSLEGDIAVTDEVSRQSPDEW